MVLLVEAVDVPLAATVVVAPEPDAVTAGDADEADVADAMLVVSSLAEVVVVVAADCAETNGSRRHSTDKSKVCICMVDYDRENNKKKKNGRRMEKGGITSQGKEGITKKECESLWVVVGRWESR